MSAEVPAHVDVLPDGRQSVVFGDVSGAAEYVHQQGENAYGFTGTCGLCSCENVLRQFDIQVTEADVVDHAVRNGLCEVSSYPERSGGTTADMQARFLTDYGIPAHVEKGRSVEDLATNVEQGRGIIVGANAGVLWNDSSYYEYGQANHAVTVTGMARDPANGQVQGFFINDSGTGFGGHFVESSDMADAWLAAGGTCVVTDVVHPGSMEGGTR